MHKITLSKFFDCFLSKNKFNYLGYTYIPFDKNSEPYKIVYNFLIYMDKKVRPKWIPKWFLNLLHLFGNDNSIVRVRNRSLHNLHRKILDGILITDLKTKWGSMCIYGHFTEEIYDEVDRVCDLLDPFIEEY